MSGDQCSQSLLLGTLIDADLFRNELFIMNDLQQSALEAMSVADLFNAALCEADEFDHWLFIGCLQRRGSREVLDRASRLCQSDCHVERRLAVNVLARLGEPERTFPVACKSVLNHLLKTDSDPEVLASALSGLCHLDEHRPIELAVRFASHPHVDVRWAAVQVFSTQDDPVSIRQLIRLSRDNAATIRDWATFALGTLTEVDSGEVREALVDRLEDPDDATREEALFGLARRGDVRAVAVLQRVLAPDTASWLALEAAAAIADPTLVPQLLALRPWDESEELLEDAIQACTTRVPQDRIEVAVA